RNFYLCLIELMNSSVPDLIARARKKDQKAKGALCFEASKRIVAGEKLEAPLAGYITDLLIQRFFNFKKTKGDKNVGRDLFAIKILSELKKRGGYPTAQDPDKNGCVYLADELNGRGLERNLTARALEEVYKKRHKVWHFGID